ncbi:hypothetical protein [Pseudonocardia acaciae]|uniref:hypothetical protein n=1 Tax=Pseudonocardia acaciae TaxID=551276 RepID=UPI0012EE699C|nr:hypothetical protein [Pseudonocardia acaciae]
MIKCVSMHVYAVHTVRPREIRATEVIWTAAGDAESYAQALSTDPGVIAGAVTRFVLNSPGERKPVALFVHGMRQQVPHLSDDRRIAANGWTTHTSPRPHGGASRAIIGDRSAGERRRHR